MLGLWGFFVTKADKILWKQFFSHKDLLLQNISYEPVSYMLLFPYELRLKLKN